MASIVGLIISIGTLLFARSASVAAKRTRDEARLASTLEELRRGEISARELANHIAANNVIKAALRAEDLLGNLRLMVEVPVPATSVDDRELLLQSKVAIGALVLMLQKLEVSGDQLSNRETTKAQGALTRTYDCFTKLRGSLNKDLEDRNE